MGKGFGELAHMRGIISFSLSPFEQKAFSGFGASIGRTIYRIQSNVFRVVPPFFMAYLVFTQTENKFHQMCRKNPADYVNDK